MRTTKTGDSEAKRKTRLFTSSDQYASFILKTPAGYDAEDFVFSGVIYGRSIEDFGKGTKSEISKIGYREETTREYVFESCFE